MAASSPKTRTVELTELGEQLAELRLCDARALSVMRRSLVDHGQLSALTVFEQNGALEILDGFKRVQAARALGWSMLDARVAPALRGVDAKLRLAELNDGRRLCELEEGWLVRSLYRDDQLTQPEIARRMGRHKSWVWRRLMLVESLELEVQAQVRLGLVSPRAAVSVGRLPRGNQVAALQVVTRRGLTVRQTELLVAEVLDTKTEARETLLARRLEKPLEGGRPGLRPKPKRAARTEADWIAADVLRVHEVAARLEARLLARPPATLPPAATELIEGALQRLSPVLRSLDEVIERVTREGAA